MTLEEAIKHAEEVAKEQDKLCKRYDGASGYSRSHNEAIRTAAAKRCEECAGEHRQLAEWLKDYKRLLEQEPPWIPLSEKGPEIFADVLCCTDSDEIFIAKYWGKMNDGTDCFDDDDGMMQEGDLIAWMPLPQTYKEEGK